MLKVPPELVPIIQNAGQAPAAWGTETRASIAFSSLVESAESKIAPQISGAFGQAFGATDKIFESKRQAVAAKFARVEEALGSGPFFAGKNFSLVDAVFAPIFRYFDVFDELIDLSIFADTPKVRAWRKQLAQRPSVRAAVGSDYPQLLHAFLVRHDAHMLKLAA